MIGGEYYFRAAAPCRGSLAEELGHRFGRLAYYSTGRDALFSLLSELNARRIWLPDYLCHSVWTAARQSGKPINFYRISDRLQGAQDWTADLEPGDVVLVIHFFGVPDVGLLGKIRARQAIAVSDATHLLFDDEGLAEVTGGSDYVIASLRKSGPFPDGAFCGSNEHSVPASSTPPREDFWTLRAAAMLSRGYSALQGFADDENFILLRKAEAILDDAPAGRHAMSFFSDGVLAATDIAWQRTAVAENAATLASRLQRICELPTLGRGLSQYFVCRFADKKSRDGVRDALGKKRIYCPVHWDTSFLARPHSLSDELLSIPCDARYDAHDMHKIADELIAIS